MLRAWDLYKEQMLTYVHDESDRPLGVSDETARALAEAAIVSLNELAKKAERVARGEGEEG